VGSNDTTAPVIEASYRRFLALFDKIVEQQTFVVGSRPASADFAIYAQLTQLAKFDPTPMSICLKEAPRIYAWTDVVDDLSGQVAPDDGFQDLASLGDLLKPLLEEIGQVYAPALLANAKALAAGEAEWQTTIDNQPWVQPSFPYQGRCLQWIRGEYEALDDSAKIAVNTLLKDTGCDLLLA